MVRVRAIMLTAIFAALCAAIQTAAAQQPDRCTAEPDMLALGAPLVRTRSAVIERKELRVVAIGSSSTEGYGATSPFNSYPAELLRTLSRHLDGVKLHVANKGVGGQEAAEMVARIERDVYPEKPDLVIWQAGTNAAIRAQDIAEFKRQLGVGISLFKVIAADVVLMTPQYAPAVTALENEDAYVAAMEAVGRQHGVGTFRRFQIMRYWLQHERMPFAHFIASDGLHLNDFGYRCIGRIFARALIRSVRDARE